jgi:hypothetical protein
MFDRPSFSPTTPWFHLGQVPVTSTVLLAGLFGVSMVVWTLIYAGGPTAAGPMIEYAGPLGAGEILRGWVWKVLTWPLFNPPDVWFILTLVALWWFGKDVETTLGRVEMLKLTGLIWLVLTMVSQLLGLPVAGGRPIIYALFIAFAILYPGAQVFFMLTAKWLALIWLVGLSLMSLARQDWAGLAWVWTGAAAAAVGLRWLGAGHSLNWLKLPQFRFKKKSSTPLARSGEELTAQWAKVRKEEAAGQAEIDRILDKISAQGFQSLSAKERATLDAASAKKRK